MNKPDALALLDSYIENKSLRTHCMAVGASMRYYAQKFSENQELWEVTGLLHDLDYEKYPDVHPAKCVEVLTDMKENSDMIHAIISHADRSQIASLIDKALFACDELSGFVYACVLVRPTKQIDGLEVSSIKKKLKDKAFARNVSREDMYNGAKLLDIPIEEHIQNVINALTAERELLGI